MIEIFEYNNINMFDDIWDETLKKSNNQNIFLKINWLKSWLDVFEQSDDEQVILCIKENNKACEGVEAKHVFLRTWKESNHGFVVAASMMWKESGRC